MDILFFYAGRNFSIFKTNELDRRDFDPTFFRK
jgi:hypothetical protein